MTGLSFDPGVDTNPAGAQTPSTPSAEVPSRAEGREAPATSVAPMAATAEQLAPVTPKKPPRDGFIDTLRAIALVRVMLWHALGNSVLSWIITTMPLMFFVAGSLLHSSLERSAVVPMMKRRLRRLLVPYWFFGAIVLTTCAIVDLRSSDDSTSFGIGQLWAWIIPLVNPTASEWEAGWASSPLWYLRAYLWILLLSPLLLKAWRRFEFGSLLGGVAIMGVAHMIALEQDAGPGALIWIVGDLGIYSFFVLLGFAHHAGKLSDLTPRDIFEWLAVALMATVVAWRIWPSPDGVVNHSYPTLLAYGCAWICLSLLARPLLSKSMGVPVLGPILYWMTRRAMSIYLWHSPGIVGAYWILSKAGISASPVPVVGLTVLFVIFASTVTGWIEDVAAGRSPDLVPLPRGTRLGRSPDVSDEVMARRRSMLVGVAIGAVATIIMASVVVESAGASRPVAIETESGLALPPAPSGRPDPSAGDSGGLALPPAPSGRPDPSAATADEEDSGGLALPPAPSGRPDPSAATADEEDSGGLALPPAPSGRPDPSATQSDTTSTQPVVSGSTSLDGVVDAWRAQRGVTGVRVGIAQGGEAMAVLSGTDNDGQALSIGDEVAVTSITKTMTASIVLQLVDEGLISLDDPLPPIDALGGATAEAPITVRQLLMHSSGLVPYQGASGYDPAASLTPQEAVLSSMSSPLEWTPGTSPGYSNSGFLTLGRLIEQVTGKTFETVLNERILVPWQLDDSSLDTEPRRGWVGDSAGGMLSTVPDLLRWGNALYRNQQVLSPAMTTAMMRVDHDLTSGLGAFPVCPCDNLGDGSMSYRSIGHNGGSVTMQYAPDSDILIVATFTESFWTDDLDQQDVYELLDLIRTSLTA